MMYWKMTRPKLGKEEALDGTMVGWQLNRSDKVFCMGGIGNRDSCVEDKSAFTGSE